MLFNRSKKQAIANNVRLAKNAWQQFKGLMFEKKARFDYALVFDFGAEKKTGASIHMLFVFFPIDAVYLDSEKRAVDIGRNLQPFSLNYTPKRNARFLIELPVGKAEKIGIGNELEW